MKKYLHFKTILCCLFIGIAIKSDAQQEFTLTTSPANITSAQALINLPELNGNPNAIILGIPQGNTATSNTHPLGVWYYSGRWYLFNTDFMPMLPGLIYKIQYFLSPGTNQFLHLVTQQNLGAEGSYINNPALNNKSNVQFSIFQNHSPDIRPGSWRNPNEAKAGYNATSGRWYITNINGQPLQKGCAYNIVVSSASGATGSDPITNPPVGSCNCPASLPPKGQATGDLAGMYPNPMVVKLLNRPLSNTPPTIGQILKWNGTEWSPSNESGGSGNSNTYTAGLGINISENQISSMASAPLWNANKLIGLDILTTPPVVGQVLKFGGGSWYPADDNVGVGGTGNGWNINGNNISNTNTGNVGIGTTTPLNKLHVEGATFLNGNVGIGTVNPTAPLQFSNTMEHRKLVLFQDVSDFYGFGVTASTLRYQIPNTGAAHVFFTSLNPAQSYLGYPEELFRINGNGNVGVGINDPAFRLDVGARMRIRSTQGYTAGLWLNNNANTEAAFIGMADDNNVGFYGKGGPVGIAGWKFKVNLNNGDAYIERSLGIGTDPNFRAPLSFAPIPGDKISLFRGNAGNSENFGFGIQGSLLQIYTDAAGSDIAFGYGSSRYFTENIRIKGNGNVGIGITNPQAKLDVNGNIKTSSLIISTGGNPSDFLIKNNVAGQVSFRKGHVGLAISYIIALQGAFPSQSPPFVSGTYIGEIRLFSGNNPPYGWAICNGQLLTIVGNESFFALIGTTYGGNGTTHFGLPDLRGSVPVGAGTNWPLGERSN